MKLKMKAKARLKSAAGADTTSAGEPDYAAMFNRWMRDHVLHARSVDPEKMGEKAQGKGLLIGDEKK